MTHNRRRGLRCSSSRRNGRWGRRPQARGARGLADDHFRSRQVERQKALDVLLGREPPGVEEDRPRQVHRRGLRRREGAVIDAARPMHQPLEAAALQIIGDRGRRHHDAGAGVVKAAQHRIGDQLRQARPRRDIFRKTRVIARRERALRPEAIAPRGETHGAFGRDVDMVDRRRLPAVCGRRRRWRGRA